MGMSNLVTFASRGPAERVHSRSAPAVRRRSGDREAELLRAVAHGERAAFDRLFRLMHPRLAAFAERLLDDRDAAEDVAQETLLDVWRRAERYHGRSSGAGWITAIAYRRIEALRAAQDPADPIPATAAAPDLIAARETTAAVRALVATLPREEREAIERCHLEGFTLAEAAAQAGRSVATVKLHLSRGRVRLRRRLGRLRG